MLNLPSFLERIEMTLVKSLYSGGDPDVIMICMTVGSVGVKSEQRQ
jgi:hypothetical protein